MPLLLSACQVEGRSFASTNWLSAPRLMRTDVHMTVQQMLFSNNSSLVERNFTFQRLDIDQMESTLPNEDRYGHWNRTCRIRMNEQANSIHNFFFFTVVNILIVCVKPNNELWIKETLCIASLHKWIHFACQCVCLCVGAWRHKLTNTIIFLCWNVSFVWLLGLYSLKSTTAL